MTEHGGPHRRLDADAAVVGAAVTTSAFVVATVGWSTRGGAAGAALAVLLVAWFTVGRTARHGDRRWPVLIGVLVAVCAVGTAAAPVFAVVQIVALPIAWTATPGLRTALVANVAVALAVGVPYAVRTSPLEALLTEAVSLGFSIAMGTWMRRIETRSAGRQALVDELTAAQEHVAALSRDGGAAAERERLARELHDTLAQSLTGVVMLAERAAARHPGDAGLSVLEDAARQALGEARGLVAAGAPLPLDGGLAGALSTLAERFRREAGLVVTAEVVGAVPRGLEVVLLRCAQEGLANVRKHARAGTVSLRVVADAATATLSVVDDGDGPGEGAGFGLAGMRDRLRLVGGGVELAPAPGGGSVLTARVPIPQEALR